MLSDGATNNARQGQFVLLSLGVLRPNNINGQYYIRHARVVACSDLSGKDSCRHVGRDGVMNICTQYAADGLLRKV